MYGCGFGQSSLPFCCIGLLLKDFVLENDFLTIKKVANLKKTL